MCGFLFSTFSLNLSDKWHFLHRAIIRFWLIMLAEPQEEDTWQMYLFTFVVCTNPGLSISKWIINTTSAMGFTASINICVRKTRFMWTLSMCERTQALKYTFFFFFFFPIISYQHLGATLPDKNFRLILFSGQGILPNQSRFCFFLFAWAFLILI